MRIAYVHGYEGVTGPLLLGVLEFRGRVDLVMLNCQQNLASRWVVLLTGLNTDPFG